MQNAVLPLAGRPSEKRGEGGETIARSVGKTINLSFFVRAEPDSQGLTTDP